VAADTHTDSDGYTQNQQYVPHICPRVSHAATRNRTRSVKRQCARHSTHSQYRKAPHSPLAPSCFLSDPFQYFCACCASWVRSAIAAQIGPVNIIFRFLDGSVGAADLLLLDIRSGKECHLIARQTMMDAWRVNVIE
jgi:hypothetical protein